MATQRRPLGWTGKFPGDSGRQIGSWWIGSKGGLRFSGARLWPVPHPLLWMDGWDIAPVTWDIVPI